LGHAVSSQEIKKSINNLISKTEGKYHFDRLDINRRIILQSIKKCSVKRTSYSSAS
jgi:hypothetical protein